jgi:hypothetical protein
MLFKRKKRYPMPEGAVISMRRGIKTAQWEDGKDRKRQAPVTKDGRIEVELATYTAKYRGADGTIIQRPTGCRSLAAAQARLSEWLSLVEKERAGIISKGEAQVSDWAFVPVETHIEDYKQYLLAQKRSDAYIGKTVQTLRKACKALSFGRIPDFNRVKAERWLLGQEGISARNHNLYATALYVSGIGLLNKAGLEQTFLRA